MQEIGYEDMKIKRFPIIAVIILVGAPLIYGWAIPDVTGCGIVAGEGAAAASMKGAIFSGQVTMQAGKFIDENNNGIGEYAFIPQLAGLVPLDGVPAGELNILTGAFANPRRVVEENDFWEYFMSNFREAEGVVDASESNKYYFRTYLPDGRGGMYDLKSYRADSDKKQGAALREQYYLVIAWPKKYADPGRKIYAMVQDGQVRSPTTMIFIQEFLETPSWELVYDMTDKPFEEILKKGPNKHWPIKGG